MNIINNISDANIRMDNPYQNIRIDNPYQNIREDFYRDEPEEVEDYEEDEYISPQGFYDPVEMMDNPDYIFTLKKYFSQPEKIKEWMTSYLSYLTGEVYNNSFLETDWIKLNGNEIGFDYTMYENTKIDEWLAENPDNIVFKFHNNFHLFTKEILTGLIENPDNIMFGCTVINDRHLVPTKDEINTTPLYFHLKRLFPAGVCPIEYIIAILSEMDKPIGYKDTRIYEAREKNPKIELMSTTSLSRINGIGDIESSNDMNDAISVAHCQPGQEEIVYEIVMLVPEKDRKKIVDGGKKTNKKTIKKVKKNKKTIKKVKKNKKINKNKKTNKKTVKKAIRKKNNKKTIKKAIKKDIRKRMR